MAIRRFGNSSITSAGGKSSKFWDQETSLGTFESIATATADGSASQILFSNIPSTYTHLQLRIQVRGVRSFASEQLYIRFNGDATSGNYRYHYLYGDGTNAVASASGADTVVLIHEFPAANETANVYGLSVVDILDVQSTSKNKTIRSIAGSDNNGNTGTYISKIWIGSGVWLNTAAVTSLTVLSNGNFATFSSVSLYGIRGA
jgi:hypothetical protein